MRNSRLGSLLLMLGLVVFSSGCVVVEDGTIGLSKSFGKFSLKPLPPDFYMSIPLFREVEVWNIKTQPLERNVEYPSAEGLKIGIKTSILFKPDPVEVISLRTKLGRDWVASVLEPSAIDAIRSVVGKLRVEDVIKNQEKLTEEAKKMLVERLIGRGVQIEAVMITGLRLPEKFNEAIEQKLQSEQRAMQKEFELQQATKDAEIEIARAQGSSKAQEIVRSTLSTEYLHYLWISTLGKNPNVIYVATEANMPAFRALPTSEKKQGSSAGSVVTNAAPKVTVEGDK